MAAQECSSTDVRSAELEAARLELARLHAYGTTSLRDVWVKLAEIASNALRVERVGCWTLIDDGRALRCRYLLQRSNHQLFQGAVLRRQDFPVYFDALKERRAIVAEDALHSALTSELRQAYLEPLGIAAMLDAPIYIGGQVVGVVCHEHVGDARECQRPSAHSPVRSRTTSHGSIASTSIAIPKPRSRPINGTSWS
jgi:two-component system cell cycle sensor histidine kinase/response regulator CckA